MKREWKLFIQDVYDAIQNISHVSIDFSARHLAE